MIKTVLTIIVILFAVLGLSEFLHSLRLACFSLGPKRKTATVIVLDEDRAVEQLSYVISQSCWFGPQYSECIIAVTDSLSEETLRDCREYTKTSNVILVPNEYISNVINAVF